MPFKQIVCLANSKKWSHRCIAGKELEPRGSGIWIRPVSKHTETGELTLDEMSFQDGSCPNLLDIVTVPLLEHTPHNYQTENYYVDPGYYWVKQDVLLPAMLSGLRDKPKTLWIDGFHSTGGVNDRIPLELANTDVRSSLYLIKPDILCIEVVDEYNKRRVRADFMYNGQRYRLSVTDPRTLELFGEQEQGIYTIDQHDVHLCISLGEPFYGHCYKLVAGLIPML